MWFATAHKLGPVDGLAGCEEGVAWRKHVHPSRVRQALLQPRRYGDAGTALAREAARTNEARGDSSVLDVSITSDAVLLLIFL